MKDAEFVKQTRKRAGLSQPAFAKSLNIPVGTLRAWEQGRTGLTAGTRALMISVAEQLRKLGK